MKLQDLKLDMKVRIADNCNVGTVHHIDSEGCLLKFEDKRRPVYFRPDELEPHNEFRVGQFVIYTFGCFDGVVGKITKIDGDQITTDGSRVSDSSIIKDYELPRGCLVVFKAGFCANKLYTIFKRPNPYTGMYQVRLINLRYSGDSYDLLNEENLTLVGGKILLFNQENI